MPGKALRDAADVVVDQGVAADVHAVVGRVGIRAEIEDAAHHRRQQHRDAGRTVAPRYRCDAQACFSLAHFEPVPVGKRKALLEAEALERFARFAGGDDRRIAVQPLLHQFVEVVVVHVRQDHQVDRRQLVEFDGRIGLALGGHPIAEVHLVALVQEVGVGQDGQSLVADQHGRGADELHGAGLRARRRRLACGQLERIGIARRLRPALRPGKTRERHPERGQQGQASQQTMNAHRHSVNGQAR